MGFAAKNEHGVYETTERMILERRVKGWQGCHCAEIELAHTPEGWRSNAEFCFFTGSCWGHFGPIHESDPPHPTREAAIAEAVAYYHRLFAKLTESSMQREAREILAWADALIPEQGDLFASHDRAAA